MPTSTPTISFGSESVTNIEMVEVFGFCYNVDCSGAQVNKALKLEVLIKNLKRRESIRSIDEDQEGKNL